MFEHLEPRQLLAAADSAVMFNEVMYHPIGDNSALEWIELHNPAAIDVDISGWRLDGGVQMRFADGTIIHSRQYLVVAANPAALAAATGLSGTLGPFSGNLSNAGERIGLMNNAGRLMDEVEYGDSGKWPAGADGSGASLAKIAPESDSSTAANWMASAEVGGTPAARNIPDPNAPPTVTQLITSGAAWKYNAGGTDLGTAWRESGYSDAAWPSGAAPLYYGSAGGGPSTGSVSAVVTADDHFVLYKGAADGSNLTLVGQDSGVWYTPVSFSNISLSAGDYLYIAAWDGSPPQMLIGDFVLPDGKHLGTNTTDWKYVVGPTGGKNSVPPSVATIQTVITGANSASSWAAPQVQTVRTTSPWGGNVGGAFTDAAKFIWADTFSLSGGSSITDTNNTYALFRTVKPVLPNIGKTQVPQGANTYYFRDSFTYSGDLSRTQLAMDTILDDGAVFYLNGYEVYRQNMPQGDVSYTTPAAGEVTDPPATTYRINLPTDHLVAGTNVLEVEVHNSTVPDADMLFGAALTATVAPPVATSISLAFNEVAAGQPAGFGLELANCGAAPLAVGGYVIANSAGGEYVLPAQTLQAGQFLSLTPAQTGFSAATGDTLFLYTPDRHKLVDAVKVDDVLRGRSPDGSGPWLYPRSATPGAANVFQFHGDVVINEIMYNHRPVFVNAALPPQDVPEQWIELYNRSDAAVDLGGWRLDDAVHYTFPAGTTIAAGGFLVVSNNAVALRLEYPAITTMVGDFSGELSQSSDHVVLKDVAGNPVDDVTYCDGGSWPEYADGGGSSLELRSPNADNSRPEAWAASDESGRTSWKTYSYSAVAQASAVGPDAQWKEFVLGLLSNGVVLLDDISVVDTASPGTQLIQNGTFESGSSHWRLLGNHSHSSVIVDPANEANHVLRLVATGPTEHMSNHAEMTLGNPGGVAIVNGHTYTISFRAKWINGSNQLNTRLYFDRAARTTLIDQPALSGTPGSPNSTYTAGVGPTYHDITHRAVVPAAMEPVTVSVTAEDPDGVASLTLRYSINGGTWQSAAMTAQGRGRYQGAVPGQAAASAVQFYVDGVDGLGTHSYFPAAGPGSRAMYRVNDGLAATSGLHNFRIIMTPADAAWLVDDTNAMSNDPVGCTVIYDESQAFYNVKVRTKASERGRAQDARLGFFVYFNPDQLFRGVYGSVGIDRSWGGAGTGQQEMLIKQAVGHAGCVSAEYSDLIQLITPNTAHTGTAELQPAHFSDLFLESQFADGGDGAQFKYEYIYYPTSTNTGTPEGLKLPYPNPDGVIGTTIGAMGAIGNLLTNSSFESWTGSAPSNWTIIAGASNVSKVTTASDGSSALKFAGDAAGTLTALTQQLSLSASSRVYTLVFRVRHDGTAPAAGSLTFSLVDGAGAVVPGGQGGSNAYTLALTGTTASYATYTATFMTPSTLPATVKLKIGLGAAVTSGRGVYVDGVSLTDLGDEKEQFRYVFIGKNNRVQDDYTRFIEFAKFWSTTGTAFNDHIAEYIDVDEWLRGFAYAVLSGAADNFSMDAQHNARFYVRPSDNRVLYFPQDMDVVVNYSYSPTMSPDLQKLLAVTSYARTYYGHLYDIIQTSWNTAYMAYWTSEYGSLLPGQDFAAQLTFIGNRSNFVLNAVTSWAGQKSAVPFAITTNAGNNFSVADVKTTLAGTGWIDVREVRLNGSDQPLTLNWTNKTTWTAAVPLAAGTNVLGLQAYDYQGKLIGTKSITVTSTVSGRPLPDNLRITELNYNPASPTANEAAMGFTNNDDFEFIELANTSTSATLDLYGARFTAGVNFDFTASGRILSMAPGGRIVLVKNEAAFLARYGTGRPVAGVYTGSLANDGEQIALVDGNGMAVVAFTYGDTGVWPGRADGGGSTLEIVDPAGDCSDPSNWQSSIQYHGTPGTAAAAADVVINEVLSRTDQPLVDAIELYNSTADPVDIGGWWLSDSNADYFKFRIPDGTTFAAHSYLVFYEGHWENDAMAFATNPQGQYVEFGGGAKPFGLNGAHGDEVYLVETGSSGNLVRFADHAAIGAAASGESWGRWQDDQGRWHFYPMLRRTLEGPNNDNGWGGNGPRIGPLVISEVMYAPALLGANEISKGFTDQEDLEFVEIYNPTSAAVALTNWRLDKGITYGFAAGSTLAVGHSLVVVPFDPANANMLSAFRTRYGNTTATVVGPYSGHLSNAGDRVQLLRPDMPPIDEPAWHPPLLEDEVLYSPSWGAGVANGKSLHRAGADAWGDYSSSWTVATASPGTVPLGRVAGRYVFYNNSAFDGRNPAANASDDAAIAADKQPLLPGGRATFGNYTSYTSGINGVMVDVTSASASVSAADFEFRAGNDGDPAAWPLVAVTPTVLVRPGAGLGGSARVAITWPDNSIKNQWLRVKVLATQNTGLAGSDVFYFGNAPGETGDRSTGPGADAVVDAADESSVRANGTALPAPVASLYDFNRDRRINATDELIARANYRAGANALRLLDLAGETGAAKAGAEWAAAEAMAGTAQAARSVAGTDSLPPPAPSTQPSTPITHGQISSSGPPAPPPQCVADSLSPSVMADADHLEKKGTAPGFLLSSRKAETLPGRLPRFALVHDLALRQYLARSPRTAEGHLPQLLAGRDRLLLVAGKTAAARRLLGAKAVDCWLRKM